MQGVPSPELSSFAWPQKVPAPLAHPAPRLPPPKKSYIRANFRNARQSTRRISAPISLPADRSRLLEGVDNHSTARLCGKIFRIPAQITLLHRCAQNLRAYPPKMWYAVYDRSFSKNARPQPFNRRRGPPHIARHCAPVRPFIPWARQFAPQARIAIYSPNL